MSEGAQGPAALRGQGGPSVVGVGMVWMRAVGAGGSAPNFRAGGPNRSEKPVPWLNPLWPQLGHSVAPAWPSIFPSSIFPSLPLLRYQPLLFLPFVSPPRIASRHGPRPHERLSPIHQNRCPFIFNSGQIDF